MSRYYEKYEQRYQAVHAVGGNWGFAPDNTDLIHVLTQWVHDNHLEGKRIIQFACGEGAAGKILTDLGCIYHGVDLAPSAVEKAKALLADVPNATVSRLDMVQDSIEGTYDAALDVMGFHILITDQDRRRYLNNVYQCLVPGGPMLFFRESYNEDGYTGEVVSYEQYIDILGEDYNTPVRKYAKKGAEQVEVMIPRMPGRHQTEAGYRRELSEAGFIVDDFQVECGWNGKRPFASIWVHKCQ